MSSIMDKPVILALHPHAAQSISDLTNDFEVYSACNSSELDHAIETAGSRVMAIVGIGRETVDRSLLSRLPVLRIIVAMGAGHEGVDCAAASQRGVLVTSAAADLSEDVADHAIAMILAARKRLYENDAWVRLGEWRKQTPAIGRSLSSEKVGIVGMGPIGRDVARKIAAFRPQIAWWGPNPHDELPWARMPGLLELSQWCSILVLAARGGPSTVGLITGEILEAIGPEGLFINVARGFMVDENALIANLRSGKLGQAALDVFAQEPADPETWRGVPNVILSPHVGGYTVERMEAARATIQFNLRSILTGDQPRNVLA